MYLGGYGYGWGAYPMNGPAFPPLIGSAFGGVDFDHLPEEVREAVEARRDEIHSEEDLRSIVEELRLKQ